MADVVWIYVMGVVLLLVGVMIAIKGGRGILGPGIACAGLLALLIGYVMLLSLCHSAHARDLDGSKARTHPELQGWFKDLHSGRGPCCSDADGSALSDTDWEIRGDHYWVFIENKWWEVPDDAVIKEPNRVGKTMVWPIYSWDSAEPGKPQKLINLNIRCFMPGTMT
jgi:hypothetical protein